MVDIYAGKDRIGIGRFQENEYRRVVFPVAPILQQYPDAAFVVLNRRKQDSAAYPVPASQIAVENGRLYWTLAAADLAYTGEGECELIAYSGSVVAKDAVYTVTVDRALDAGIEPPDGWEDYLADLAEIADRAVTAKEAAEVAQGAAETAQGFAESARDTAILAKTGAEAAQSQAEGFAIEAETNANTAISKAGEAAASATAAETAQGKAEAAAELLENVSAEAETLEPGSAATAEYSNGVFSFGIPAGEPGQDGQPGKDGQDGAPGADGFSPAASVSKSGNTATITITDKTGTTTATVSDGATGQPGEKGDKGDPGDDYVLTAADKEEIAGIAAEEIQPELSQLKSEINVIYNCYGEEMHGWED